MKNLLMWDLAVSLSTEQRQLIESAGVELDDIHPDFEQFAVNQTLLRKLCGLCPQNRKECRIRICSSEYKR